MNPTLWNLKTLRHSFVGLVLRCGECVWGSSLKIDQKSTEHAVRKVPEGWLVPPCNPAADPLPFLDATENRRKNEGLLESGQDIPGSPKRPKGSPKNQPKIGLLNKKIAPKQILCRFFVRKVLFVFLL